MLLVGLGNPGDKYAGTRHNIGFDIIESIMREYDFASPLKKFSALYSEGEISGKKVRVLMPQTFMNLSGSSVQQAMGFYKERIENIVVIHDELDLPLGKLRMKIGGSAGGHNGLKSIDEHIGQNYKRMRFGIGHPGNKNLVSSYVLSKFANPERPIVEDLVKIVTDNISLVVDVRDELFMTRFAEGANKIEALKPVEEPKPKKHELKGEPKDEVL